VIVDRPWGRTQTYALNQPATARLVTMVPGGDTGAHYHRLRDELWIVLDPGLTIDIGTRVLHPEPGDELQVPAEEPHRIRCADDVSGRVLQIAFGYQSDDDRLPVEGGPAGDDG
jgi:mannose-1-phosphate guanylyltransferase/mannose-6-phosphate isomerase